MPVQNDTKALKIMFPAAQNDKIKNAKKPKQNKLATVRFVMDSRLKHTVQVCRLVL